MHEYPPFPQEFWQDYLTAVGELVRQPQALLDLASSVSQVALVPTCNYEDGWKFAGIVPVGYLSQQATVTSPGSLFITLVLDQHDQTGIERRVERGFKLYKACVQGDSHISSDLRIAKGMPRSRLALQLMGADIDAQYALY